MSAIAFECMANENNLVDKLKTIRPFTESQLSQLHSINDLKENDNVVDCFLYECRVANDSDFYENVNNFKRAREALSKTRVKLGAIKTECESMENKVWDIESKTIKKRLRCSDGRMVEGKHTYNEANLNKEMLKNLERNIQTTKNLLANDYCNNYYTAQICQKEIEAEVQVVINERDKEIRTPRIRTLISSMFAFQRTFEEVDAEFVHLIKKWITELVAVLLQDASYNDRLFLLNHVLRCPGGVTSWTASFVQCKSPLQACDNQEAASILNHCLTVISTILSPIKDRERFVGTGSNIHVNNPEMKLSSDDLWYMVDNEVDEGEDVLINKLNLTETDIIRLLQQVPFDDLLEYIAVKQFQDDNSQHSFNSLNVSEYSMLKILSVTTKMIQILRQGLITFNCFRFRTLTDYITLLIRKSVYIVSNSWQKCKGKLRTDDQAMLLRLQVEYDHFVLRSVVAILSSQRHGVWRFVSVIPFDGVTESMMWHILWVFYNNGRDEVDELGGLCPYFSDSYWRSKFNEPAMKYLFQEKLPTLSVTECECLLQSLGNMIKSRESSEVEFISTVAVEMFEMGFLMLAVSDKMVSTCTELFAELSLQHPFLISPLVLKIRDSNCFNEQCIDLFEKVPLYLWKPDEHILNLLGDWLAKSAFNTIFNRLSRLIISKLNWGLNEDQTELFLGIKFHRLMAILLYEAMYEQIKVQDGLENCNCSVYSGFDEESYISCAKSETRKAFVEFCWRTALTLKLYLREQPNWKKISFHNLDSDSTERGFYPLPNINTDCELLSIFKGLENQNPFAIYFTLVMTETGHSITSFDANIELFTVLVNTKNHIPALDILHWFIPFHINKMEDTLNDNKFITAMNQLLLSEENGILDRVIGLINSQMKNYFEIKKQLFTFWINILCEISGCVLKQYSSSWFIASSKGLQQVVHLLDAIVMLVFGDDSFEHLLTDLLIQKTAEMQSLKLPSTGSWFSWGSNSKKSDWISPLHFLSQKFPDKVWFASALIKCDIVKTEKIWEEVLVEMNNNLDSNVEVALKNVCNRLMVSVLPLNVLPICSWAKLAVDSPVDHILLPMICYNFFICFFASVETGASMGSRIIGDVLHKKLKVKMNSQIEHFHNMWSNATAEGDTAREIPYTNLMRLYRALLSWLEDTHLHDPFVDVERLPIQYHAELLKSVMNSSDHLMKNYVDEESLEKQILMYFDLWQQVKHVKLNVVNVSNSIKSHEFSNFGDIKPFRPPEYKQTNMKIQQIDDAEIMNCRSETILSILQQHIRIILEENKYFDNRLAKFSNLSTSLIELISNNYDNIRKEFSTKIPCDKDGYDPDGCSGPAAMTFEFYEAVENKQNSKLIERNRIDENNLMAEIYDTPSDRAVSVAIYLTKAISLISKRQVKDENEHLLQSLVSFYLASIPDANNILFAPTKHIFNVILDTLNSESETNRDSTSLFVLQTALSYPQTIQFLAPLLVPSNCTSVCFKKMYQILQKNIESTPNHVLFVLLSKFDVNSWLKLVSERESTEFLHILGNALFAFGKNPAEDKLMVLGLYRKHLQYMAICRFPMYLEEVFKIILNGMRNFAIHPLLWNDLLLSFGFYVNFPNVKLKVLVSELQKYANSQPLFCSNELYSLLSVICDHFETLKEEKPRLNLLEYFKDYVEPFSVMLSTVSFMWINLNSKNLTDFQIVWNPFLKVWKPWIFITYFGQEVDTSDFERIWDLFVANLHYFIHCFFGLSSCVLSLCWQLIATEFLNQKGQVCPKSAKAIQEKLSTLLWKRFVPSESDINLMYQSSQNENNSPNLLINKILYSVNWRNCAQFIPYNRLSQSMEWLSYTIITVVTDPQNILISEIPLHLITAQDSQSICVALRRKVDLEYYFDKRDDLMLMWLTMIKIICCIPGSDETDNDELLKKQIIYATTVTGIIEDATKNNEQFFKKRSSKLKFFIESFLDDLTNAFKKDDSSHRHNIFSTLFNFIKSLPDDEDKVFVVDLLKNRAAADKHLIVDFMSSACKCVSDLALLIIITEHCFTSFAVCDGSLEYLLSKFDRNVISSDFYLNCLHQNAFLSLLLCYEKKKPESIQSATVEMIDWCSQVKLKSSTESKVVAVWYAVVKDTVHSLTPDESSLPLFQSTLRLIKFLLAIVDEVVSQGLLSFMKISKRSMTPRCTFISLVLAVVLLKKVDEMITNIHPLHSELCALLKTSASKVQALKKHKAFVDFVSLLEEVSKLYDSHDVVESGVPLIRNWLLTYYSDVPFMKLIIV